MKPLELVAREYANKIINHIPGYTIDRAKRIFKDKYSLVFNFIQIKELQLQNNKSRTALITGSFSIIYKFKDLQIMRDKEFINMVQKNYQILMKDADNPDLKENIKDYLNVIPQIKKAYLILEKEVDKLLTIRTPEAEKACKEKIFEQNTLINNMVNMADIHI